MQGADLEAKDKHGISVVLAAIWEGHSKCVAFLISKVRRFVGPIMDGGVILSCIIGSLCLCVRFYIVVYWHVLISMS